jgi:RNA polymerase sigma-70 factor (sigma-E family)
MADDEQFQRFVADRAVGLRGLAYLITGSWAAADDLLQEALIKAYLRWRTIHTDPEAYVRRVLVTTAVDERRRPHRREHATADPPDRAQTGDSYAGVDSRLAVRTALAALPPRQRAAVALRYWVGLDLAEVAELLDCSVGTVKSQSSRGLVALRAELARHAPLTED